MPSHTLMVRFNSEAAAQSFEQWLHRIGRANTSRAGADVTVALRSAADRLTVEEEAERRGGELAWDEDDSGETTPAL